MNLSSRIRLSSRPRPSQPTTPSSTAAWPTPFRRHRHSWFLFCIRPEQATLPSQDLPRDKTTVPTRTSSWQAARLAWLLDSKRSRTRASCLLAASICSPTSLPLMASSITVACEYSWCLMYLGVLIHVNGAYGLGLPFEPSG